MDQDREKMRKRILNFTLDILYLLTGEDYTVVKKTSDEHVTLSSLPHVSEGWSRSQGPITKPKRHSVTPEINDKKILEITNKITELLTGEVPIRCQDVTIYFSMEEWRYVEGHKDLYKDVMMKDQPPLQSPDGFSNRNPPERCPSPLDSTQEDHNISHDSQAESMFDVKVVSIAEEELYVRGDEQEDIHAEIGTDGRYRRYNVEECVVISADVKVEDDNISSDYAREGLITPNLCPVLYSADTLSDPSTHGKSLPNSSPTVNHQTAHGWGGKFLSSRRCKERVELAHQESQTLDKPYSCSDCGKCFSQKALLNRHQKSHTGEKPYQCLECGKSFSQGHYLMLHQRMHTGEKPYSCSECGKCFFRNDHLMRHRRFHTGEKPYSCSQCGKCFSVRFCLTEHERIHTGERPYSCSDCGKNFTSKSNLASHRKVHANNRPYPCSQCGKSFASKSQLANHERVHTGDQP